MNNIYFKLYYIDNVISKYKGKKFQLRHYMFKKNILLENTDIFKINQQYRVCEYSNIIINKIGPYRLLNKTISIIGFMMCFDVSVPKNNTIIVNTYLVSTMN